MIPASRRYFALRNPGSPRWRVLWWEFVIRPLSWIFLFGLYRHRCWGVRHVPDEGPVLLLCNHQSFLDPLALGVSLDHRQFCSMARATLFRHSFFAWLIRSLHAFPVEQGKGDVKSVRRAIELLRQGHLLLIFPEGSRTPDGMVQNFSPGLMILVKRAGAVVVPAALDGVYDAWSIHRGRPRFGGARTGAIYGKPIPAAQLLAMTPADATAYLQRRVDDLRLELRRRLRRLSHNRFPLPGDGDIPAVDFPDAPPNNAAP